MWYYVLYQHVKKVPGLCVRNGRRVLDVIAPLSDDVGKVGIGVISRSCFGDEVLCDDGLQNLGRFDSHTGHLYEPRHYLFSFGSASKQLCLILCNRTVQCNFIISY